MLLTVVKFSETKFVREQVPCSCKFRRYNYLRNPTLRFSLNISQELPARVTLLSPTLGKGPTFSPTITNCDFYRAFSAVTTPPFLFFFYWKIVLQAFIFNPLQKKIKLQCCRRCETVGVAENPFLWWRNREHRLKNATTSKCIWSTTTTKTNDIVPLS